MKSGVRKSGWPMPRLMMSRPCAWSALARARTAKAFSSPMRSNAAMVLSMLAPLKRFLVRFGDFRRFGPVLAPPPPGPSTGGWLPRDLDLGHLHDLENNGNRPA